MNQKFENSPRQYSLYTLVAVVAVLTIVISFVSMYITSTNYQNTFIRFSIEQKILLAKNINEVILSQILPDETPESLKIKRDYLRKLVNAREVQYIRIITPAGKIILSTEENEEGQVIQERDLLRSITEQKLVIRDGVFKGERLKLMLFSDSGGRIIWMGVLPTEIIQTIKKLAWNQFIPIFLLSTFAAAIVTGMTFFILRGFIKQLRRMIWALEKVQQGNLDLKIDVRSKTEIGQLTNTFNRMIRSLKDSRLALEEAKSLLEIKVVAQTKALKALALNLDAEVEQRTLDLQAKIRELERFQKLAIGRETKIEELKKEVTRLKEEFGNLENRKT